MEGSNVVEEEGEKGFEKYGDAGMVGSKWGNVTFEVRLVWCIETG